MKTEKLYYIDSYMSEFDATVVSCEPSGDNYIVVLDKTAFFPEEGGQYSDTGMLGEAFVSYAKEKDGIIYHTVDNPLEIGATVHGRINFDERFEKMQCHSGEHIVSGLIFKFFGLTNVGFHLGRDDVTLDFDGILTDEQIALIEKLANQVIYQNKEILCEFPSDEVLKGLDYRSKLELTHDVRIVTVPEVDVCACCAPHVAKTGEIGIIKLLDRLSYKGGIRIHMLCGVRALTDYNLRYSEAKQISNMLSVKQHDTPNGVKRLFDECASHKADIAAIKRKILAERIESITPTDDNLVKFEEILDVGYMREYVNQAIKVCGGLCAVFISNNGGYNFIIGSKNHQLRELAGLLKSDFNARCGGTDEMISGSFSGDISGLADFLSKYKK